MPTEDARASATNDNCGIKHQVAGRTVKWLAEAAAERGQSICQSRNSAFAARIGPSCHGHMVKNTILNANRGSICSKKHVSRRACLRSRQHCGCLASGDRPVTVARMQKARETRLYHSLGVGPQKVLAQPHIAVMQGHTSARQLGRLFSLAEGRRRSYCLQRIPKSSANSSELDVLRKPTRVHTFRLALPVTSRIARHFNHTLPWTCTQAEMRILKTGHWSRGDDRPAR